MRYLMKRNKLIYGEDGSFRYLGNKILDDGLSNIPEYQYRIVRK